MNETNLQLAQNDVAARLNADEYFVDIPVITDHKANAVSDIEKAIGAETSKAGKVGVCVVVLGIVASVPKSNVQVAIMGMDISILVLEDPTYNGGTTGTGKSALSIARRIIDVMYMFVAHGTIKMMMPDNPTIVPVESDFAPVAYEVRFKSTEDFQLKNNKVSMPSMTTPQSAFPYTVTLTCPTAGATIYYTLDGGYPAPPSGIEYTAPFTVSTACSVRVGAEKTGMISSDATVTKLS